MNTIGTKFLFRSALLAILSVFAITANTQTTYTWNLAGGGSWTTASNWTPNRTTPAANDILVIANGGTKTITDVPTQTIGRLQVSGNTNVTLTHAATSARTLTISNATTALDITGGSTLTLIGNGGGGTRTLTLNFSGAGNNASVAGNLIVSTTQPGVYDATNSNTNITGTLTNSGGTITSTAANLSFASGGTYIHGVNGGTIPTATWNANSNCTITGITNTAPGGLTQSFGNFTWNCAGHSATINLNSALTTINGNFTVNQGGNPSGMRVSDPLVLSSNTSFTLTVGGNLTLSNTGVAAWLALTNGTATVTMNVGGNFLMSNATTFFDYAIGTTMNPHVVNVSGNLDISGGLFDWTFTPTAGSNFATLNLSGNFSLSGTGAMTTSVGSTTIPNGRLVFAKAGTQTITVTNPANLIYTNFQVNSGSTTELLSSFNLTSQTAPFSIKSGRFEVLSGGIVDFNTNQLLSSSGAAAGVANSFVLNSGAGLITANTNGVQNTTVGSVSASIATRTFSSGANYTYDGVAAQNSGLFTTTPTASQVNNLTINNSAGSASTGVTLQQPFAVAGTLSLTNGLLTTTATNLLTMNAGSSVAGQNYTSRIPGSSDNSFVNGPMRKTGNTDFLFPVGKINNGQRFCGISAPALATDAFDAEFIRASATALGSITASGLHHVSNCEYWTINRSSGSATVNITLSWSGSSACNAIVYVNDPASLVVAHFGTSWDSYGNDGGYTGNATLGSVTWNNVSTFSPFTLGSTDPVSNPLPVTLSTLTVTGNGTTNKLNWVNETEADIRYYEAERSADGIRFNSIYSTAARSNNNDRQAYSHTDANNVPETAWYRIKLSTASGQVQYSNTVKVSREKNVNSLLVYPNPVTQQQFTLQWQALPGIYQLRLFSGSGQQVWQKQIPVTAAGIISQNVQLPDLPAGLYHLELNTGSSTRQHVILIK